MSYDYTCYDELTKWENEECIFTSLQLLNLKFQKEKNFFKDFSDGNKITKKLWFDFLK